MLWREFRLALFVLVATILAACGYQPALKTEGFAARLVEGFDVSVAGGREGFVLEELLMQRLGTSPQSASYQLSARIEIAERVAATPGAGGVDRKELEAIADYQIRLAGDSEIISSGSVDGSALFSAGLGAVATGAARRDAERRMLTEVADRLYSRLILTAQEWAR